MASHKHLIGWGSGEFGGQVKARGSLVSYSNFSLIVSIVLLGVLPDQGELILVLGNCIAMYWGSGTYLNNIIDKICMNVRNQILIFDDKFNIITT